VTKVVECDDQRLVLDKRGMTPQKQRIYGMLWLLAFLFVLFGDIYILAKGMDFVCHPPFVAEPLTPVRGCSTEPTDFSRFPYPNLFVGTIDIVRRLFMQQPIFGVVVGLLLALLYSGIWRSHPRNPVQRKVYIFDKQLNELTITYHYHRKPPQTGQYSLQDCQGAIVESKALNQFWLDCRVVLRLNGSQTVPLTEYRTTRQSPSETIADTINQFLAG
jgi:hypothetical protein